MSEANLMYQAGPRYTVEILRSVGVLKAWRTVDGSQFTDLDEAKRFADRVAYRGCPVRIIDLTTTAPDRSTND